MKIVQLPNETLRKKTAVIKKITPKIREIISEMIKTLNSQKNPPGVGLAAPQIGYSLKIFIIKPPEKEIKLFINPELIEQKGEYQDKDKNLEGCLSLHGYYGSVKRNSEVKLTYQEIDEQKNDLSKPITEVFKGFPAVIIQHELDHLEGIMFIDKIFAQKGKLYKTAKNKDQKEILEEVEI